MSELKRLRLQLQEDMDAGIMNQDEASKIEGLFLEGVPLHLISLEVIRQLANAEPEVGQPVPERATFYYITEDKWTYIYKYEDKFLLVDKEDIVLKIIENEDDLPDEVSMTGAFF